MATSQNIKLLSDVENVDIKESLISIKCKTSLFQCATEHIFVIKYDNENQQCDLHLPGIVVNFAFPKVGDLVKQRLPHFFKIPLENGQKLLAVNIAAIAFVQLETTGVITLFFSCGTPVTLSLGTAAVAVFQKIAELQELLQAR